METLLETHISIISNESANNQIITGNEVKSDKIIDYDRLINDFGCQRIDNEIIQLLEKIIENRGLSSQRHKYMSHFTRGIFFSHRDFKTLLVDYIAGKQFYLYTGRGPSSYSMHIGHLVPFQMTQLLQELFDVQVVIQLTDDEKYYYDNNGKRLTDFKKMADENTKDIMACGFNPQKTFIFTNTEYIQHLYPTIIEINKASNFNLFRSVFGFDNHTSIGKISFPSIQAAPCFSRCFTNLFSGGEEIPCLIPCAIDQDSYFRMTRDIAHKIGGLKPILLHAKFLPSLNGLTSKMSSSIPDSVIFLSDEPKMVNKKIQKSFSGGGKTLEEHRLMGGNLDVDVSIHYLKFFLPDDQEYEQICKQYREGTLTSGEIKKKAVTIINSVIKKHKLNRLDILL